MGSMARACPYCEWLSVTAGPPADAVRQPVSGGQTSPPSEWHGDDGCTHSACSVRCPEGAQGQLRQHIQPVWCCLACSHQSCSAGWSTCCPVHPACDSSARTMLAALSVARCERLLLPAASAAGCMAREPTCSPLQSWQRGGQLSGGLARWQACQLLTPQPGAW